MANPILIQFRQDDFEPISVEVRPGFSLRLRPSPEEIPVAAALSPFGEAGLRIQFIYAGDTAAGAVDPVTLVPGVKLGVNRVTRRLVTMEIQSEGSPAAPRTGREGAEEAARAALLRFWNLAQESLRQPGLPPHVLSPISARVTHQQLKATKMDSQAPPPWLIDAYIRSARKKALPTAG